MGFRKVKGLQSQCAQILKWLREGKPLTPLLALEQFGCFRLAARINDLRYAGGEEHNVKYVSEVDYDRVVAERDSLQAQNEASKQRIARLHHVGLELTGVIDEYRAMPCASLQERMFKTADRYRRRLTAKCATCEDWGVIGYTTGQTPETFEQGEYPCPDCTEGKSHE